MARVLFIGHDAGRSGAPIVLLHLLKWLKRNDADLEIEILLLRGGELVSEHRQLGKVYVLDPSSTRNRIKRGLRKLRGCSSEWYLPSSFRGAPFSDSYDLVLGNTIVTLPSLKHFNGRGVRTICWMHEMEFAIRAFFSPERFAELSENVDMFIVPSKAVQKTLRDLRIERPTKLVYEFSPLPETATVEPEAVRKSLNVPSDAFVVAGGGRVERRKGTDLFLQISALVCAREPKIYFIWIGGRTDNADKEYDSIKHGLAQLELADRVKFTGTTDEPEKYLSISDVFALTSREDPFPLFCLEAAALAKPVICFDEAGGMPEFVEDDAGAVVPYLDINAFADKLIEYYNDRGKTRQAGAVAKQKVSTRFSAEESCGKISDLIHSVLRSG
jgi:glycosyltransferase involved in cell wall biosynthesis